MIRDKVFINKPIEACYGCQACVQICTHNVITMTPNEEGFIYPLINSAKCVDCGLCEKVCPTQVEPTDLIFNATPQKVYALWNKQLSERLKSTSGGAFFLLADKFLDEGGIVYGVDFDEDLIAYHRRIDNRNELHRLRGSKYIQSDINTTYEQAKSDLQAGKKVLFSGTPCQIAGLKLFLRKTYDNLVTIDLVCHGTPSPKIFKEHKHYIENKYDDKLTDFKFRAKEKTGWRSYAKYIFKQSKSVRFFWGKDYYCHAFHSGYLNRESCFTCQFSRSQRVGDITLSDFWNGEKYSKELKRQRKFGFNLVMCNTIVGQKWIDSISDKAERRIFPVEYAIQGDVRLRHTEPRPSFRSEAYKICQEKGYKYMVDMYGYKPSILQKMMPTWMKNIIREIQSRL